MLWGRIMYLCKYNWLDWRRWRKTDVHFGTESSSPAQRTITAEKAQTPPYPKSSGCTCWVSQVSLWKVKEGLGHSGKYGGVQRFISSSWSVVTVLRNSFGFSRPWFLNIWRKWSLRAISVPVLSKQIFCAVHSSQDWHSNIDPYLSMSLSSFPWFASFPPRISMTLTSTLIFLGISIPE